MVSDIANDNKLTPSEKQSLKKEYDIIVAEKPQISEQATPYHINAERTAYNTAYNNLITFVNPLIVNLNNTSDVDGVTLRSRFTSYYTAKVNLLKAITDAVDNNLDSVWDEMENLQNSVNQEIADVTQQVNNLEGYVDGAFSDGIISQAEAVAIEKYINQINTEKSDIDNKYNQIYNDYYLSGTPKNNLATDYNNYVSSHTNLINSINTAISDGATTPTEKSDVDSKFSAYRLALGVLTTRFQEAIKAIETATVNAIQVGGRNLLKNTAFKENIIGWFGDGAQGAIISWDSIEKAIYLNNGNNGGSILQHISLNPGKYIISFDVKPQFQNQGSSVRIKTSIQKGDFVPIHTTSQFKRYEILFEVLGVATWVAISANGEQRLLFKNIKLEKGNKATDWTPAPEDVDSAIANAQNTATNAQNAINATNQTVTNLSGYIDGAFQDGIIEASEAIAIEKYINQINTEKANLDGSYNTLYANELLTGTPKSNLSSAKTIFDTSFSNLINSINTAISDGATTTAEKADVDAKFVLYRNAIQNLQQKIEEANASIQALINTSANTANQTAANALAQAQNAINTANAAASVTSFMQTTVDGNVISTGTLQVGDVNGANAMISGVTDRPNGESIRFAAGKNYANKYLSTFQVLDNGMVRFVNPLTGQKTFELGFNKNTGKVVFDIYNENGVKIATIGTNGIEFTGYIPESYSKASFKKLNTTSFTESAILSVFTESIFERYITEPGPPRYYDIGFNIDTESWLYNEGRNFESAGNAQYVGYYPTQNKLGTPIPDGIYVRQLVDNIINQEYINIESVAFRIVSGKIMDFKNISKAIRIASIPLRATPFPLEY